MEMRFQNQSRPFDSWNLGGRQKGSDSREHLFKSLRNRDKTGMSSGSQDTLKLLEYSSVYIDNGERVKNGIS